MMHSIETPDLMEDEVVNEGNDFDDEMEVNLLSDDDEPTDNVGDASVEINVEEIISEMENAGHFTPGPKQSVRRRLEELAEQQSFEDTYAIEFD